MSTPQRIQRRRTKGWRMPENAVYVGRGTRWGNQFSVGKTKVRTPAVNGGDWEHEGRLHKTSGESHVYVRWIDGKNVYTQHQVELATREQVVQMFREYVGLGPADHLAGDFAPSPLDVTELVGKDLVCWCPLEDSDGNQVPCHADVLLELANREIN